MSGDSEDDVYEIDIEYTDSGFQMVFALDEWYERIEDEFGSFEAIKEFYRTDPEELREEFQEGFREVDPDEARETPGIIINNPPKEWKEDPSQAARFLELAHYMLVQVGLSVLIENEIEDQETLLTQDRYKPLVIRQSAFYEEYLTFQSLLKFQEQKDGTLSSSELDIIERMGHQDRLRLAKLFDVISEEEHGLLQEMVRWRNDIAHTAWTEFDSQDESQIQSVAERVIELLESEFVNTQEEIDETEATVTDEEFDIGFTGLDTELQNLQLSILHILNDAGGSAELSYIQDVLVDDPEVIRQRSYRMDHIGYVELEDEELRITDKGEELLEEHWPNHSRQAGET